MQVIEKYAAKWGQAGQTYDCWYNPNAITQIVRVRTFSRSHAIHSLLWPSVLLILATVSLIVAFFVSRRYQLKNDPTRMPPVQHPKAGDSSEVEPNPTLTRDMQAADSI